MKEVISSVLIRVIISGSRDFDDYDLLTQKVDFYLKGRKDVEIVSGMARGADRLGEQYAQSRGLSLKQFPADWEQLGKSAGYLRNKEMAQYATHAIIFWDGSSRGTSHMIDLAKEYKLNYRVVRFEQKIKDENTIKSKPTGMMVTRVEKRPNQVSMQELIDYMPGYEWISPPETDRDNEIEAQYEELKARSLRNLKRDMQP